MGCAPSIHVSQSTGVVYCRDENVKTLKHSRTASLSISEVVSHIPPANQSDSLGTEGRVVRLDKERDSSLSARGGVWIEAETQTLKQALLHYTRMEIKVTYYFQKVSLFRLRFMRPTFCRLCCAIVTDMIPEFRIWYIALRFAALLSVKFIETARSVCSGCLLFSDGFPFQITLYETHFSLYCAIVNN